ncbi:MAG: Asp-tRNA(Asn)/Glu-tRNA(Gln) amidotransferase subunit GatC [Alphaproteobacteria bacterium]
MSINRDTVEQAARLARLTIADEDKDRLAGELSAILGFVEQLNAIDTDGVEPLTSVVGATARMRKDEVTAGDYPERVLSNAPDRVTDFYAVPKVVE